MNSETIKDYFFEKLKKPGYDDLTGIALNLHLPVKASFINFALRNMIATSDGMKDFREITFSDVDDRLFFIKLNHKMIKKQVRCRFDEIESNQRGEQKLTIEFLNGIKFYEKAALNTFHTFRQGWSRFKAAFRGTGPKALEGEKPFWEITGSHVTINIDAALRKQDLGFIAPALQIRDITTKDDRFVLDLRIKT